MQRDAAYLRDIQESARLALAYLEGVDMEAFAGNTQLQDAVIRRVEIIGEAARRVSAATRALYPALPWRQMIGMRNQVISRPRVLTWLRRTFGATYVLLAGRLAPQSR